MNVKVHPSANYPPVLIQGNRFQILKPYTRQEDPHVSRLAEIDIQCLGMPHGSPGKMSINISNGVGMSKAALVDFDVLFSLLELMIDGEIDKVHKVLGPLNFDDEPEELPFEPDPPKPKVKIKVKAKVNKHDSRRTERSSEVHPRRNVGAKERPGNRTVEDNTLRKGYGSHTSKVSSVHNSKTGDGVRRSGNKTSTGDVRKPNYARIANKYATEREPVDPTFDPFQD